MPSVSAKKKCCKDAPRCATCPVVLMRLERLGHAEACEKKRGYVVAKKVPKKALRLARRR